MGQLRYVILTIAWMTMVFSGIQICQADHSDEPERIQVTRWMDPSGRLPITYSDWNSIQPPHRDMIEMVRSPTQPVPPSTGAIRVLIRDAIYPSLAAAIGQYVDDLTAQGYTASALVGDFATPAALRAWLQAEYADSHILGAVIIGDWPVPWYEMDDDFDDQHAEFPCDLYYMDLDGTWGDGDTDGLFDTHTAGSGDVGLEIWIGRLTFSPLTYTGATEVELLNAYFDKNHRYRTGQLWPTKAALAYNDDDWDTFADTCGELDLCLTYGSGNVTFVTDPETTTVADYKTRFVQNREFIHVMSHGSPGGHGFYRDSGAIWEWMSFSDVISHDPLANYYLLFSCSGCRYVETDYVGGWYINGSYGLVSIGSTKTGGLWLYPEFYTPMSAGSTVADAYYTWFNNVAADGFDQSDRRWWYGMTVLGDPTLGPKATTPDPYETNAIFRVDEHGNVLADQTFYGTAFNSGSADIAEWVQISTVVEPGDIIEFDPMAPMRYRITQDACSLLVAGVISTTPGVILGGSLVASEKALLALIGIVPVKVSNEGGPIQPGDLLVTSSTPGHAMRWAGPDPCPCSLVGKALEPMVDEQGVILILLTAH